METNNNGLRHRNQKEDSFEDLSQETVDFSCAKRKAHLNSDKQQSEKKKTKIEKDKQRLNEAFDFLSETINSKKSERREKECLNTRSSTDFGACPEDTSSETNSVKKANRNSQWFEKESTTSDQSRYLSDSEEISDEEFQKCIADAEKGIVRRPAVKINIDDSGTGRKQGNLKVQNSNLLNSPFNSPSKKTITERVAASERHVKALIKEKQRLEQKIEINKSRLNKAFSENAELKCENKRISSRLISLFETVKQLQRNLELQQQIIG